jgi:membrane protease YdiL (CAAX protease family)
MIILDGSSAKRVRSWFAALLLAATSWIIGGVVGGGVYLVVTRVPALAPDTQTGRLLLNMLVGVAAYGTVLLCLYFGSRLVYKLHNIRDIFGLRGRLKYGSLLGIALAYTGYWLISRYLPPIVHSIFPAFNPDALQNYDGVGKLKSWSEILPAYIQMAVLTPVVEEILFRGFLVGQFLRLDMPNWLIITATSIIFGLMHPPLNASLDVGILAVFLGYLRLKTGNVYASILLHMVASAIAFYTLFVAS